MNILICNWRDTQNPEGGGSERYVETMARGLVEHGHTVTIACAAYGEAPRDELVDGVRFVRSGNKLDIYLRTFLSIILGRYGRVDLVVDVQNGLPFFTRLATRRPVIVLVHHVHREQWPVVHPGLMGRFGWWLESRVAPRLYRSSQYVAVSEATRRELIDLGVGRERITVIHNGNEPAPDVASERSKTARIVVVSRLVPHKQIEHAIDAVAALYADHPDLVLDIVGSGWWEPELIAYAAEQGVTNHVVFHGFVDEQTKHELLAQAWFMLLPSLKEGWGLVVGEAGAHGTPTIAYRSAGGTTESIDDKDSGLLVDAPHDLVDAARELTENRTRREFLGNGALRKSHEHSWQSAQQRFNQLVGEASAAEGSDRDQLLEP